MNDLVWLLSRRQRGWPWPEDSFGLTPMFGKQGWCHDCGMPRAEQTGQLTLQRRALTTSGAWQPNWLFDTYCLDVGLAEKLGATFSLDLRPVAWPKPGEGEAVQLVVPTVGPNWYSEAELTAACTAVHGTPGATCPTCKRWRWLPLRPDKMPKPRYDPAWADLIVLASPEWFGDGWKSFRIVLMRTALAEAIVAASPADFLIEQIDWA